MPLERGGESVPPHNALPTFIPEELDDVKDLTGCITLLLK